MIPQLSKVGRGRKEQIYRTARQNSRFKKNLNCILKAERKVEELKKV